MVREMVAYLVLVAFMPDHHRRECAGRLTVIVRKKGTREQPSVLHKSGNNKHGKGMRPVHLPAMVNNCLD